MTREQPRLSHRIQVPAPWHREGPPAFAIPFKLCLSHFFRGIQHLVQLIHYSFQLLFAASGRALRRGNSSRNVSHSFLPWPLTRPTSAPVTLAGPTALVILYDSRALSIVSATAEVSQRNPSFCWDLCTEIHPGELSNEQQSQEVNQSVFSLKIVLHTLTS